MGVIDDVRDPLAPDGIGGQKADKVNQSAWIVSLTFVSNISSRFLAPCLYPGHVCTAGWLADLVGAIAGGGDVTASR